MLDYGLVVGDWIEHFVGLDLAVQNSTGTCGRCRQLVLIVVHLFEVVQV